MMSKSKIFLLASLIFIFGNFLYLYCFENKGNHNFDYGSFYTFRAKVKDVDKKLDGYNIIVSPQNLSDFSGDILVYNYLYPEYNYGDILDISCKIYKPEKIISDEGKTFAYDKYLAKDNIFATCFKPKISKISEEKDISFYIFKTKKYFWTNLNNNLIEPSSSLSKAMFLASRREIPDGLRDVFAKVGLSHIVAISGLHMAIFVWLFQSFLFRLGLTRKLSLYFLFIFLGVYLYIIGFPSSAVRASLMVLVLMLGPFLKRDTESIFSLILVADIFLLFNPYLLLYDIGFQLSFLAVLGLLYYVRFFNKVLFFIPEKFRLREVISVTLAAQVFTWPLIVYNFGIFSMIAPVANILILPLLPAVLMLSIALGLLGIVAWLAIILSWPLFLLLKIIVYISERLANIPYAFVVAENFSLSYMLLALLFMAIFTWILKPKFYE